MHGISRATHKPGSTWCSVFRHSLAPKTDMASLLKPHEQADYYNAVQELFDQRGSTYDNPDLLAFHKPMCDSLVALCELKPGQHVLDIAAGTGLVTIPAAVAVGPTGSVTALDLSEGMLAQTRAKVDALLLESVPLAPVHIVHGNAEEVQLEAGAYDVIMCCSSILFFKDIPDFLNLCHRWLKPSPQGKLGLQSFKGFMNPEFSLLFEVAQAHGFTSVQDPNACVGSRAACEALLDAAGFHVTRWHEEEMVKWEVADSVEAYADKMWKMGTTSIFWPKDVQGNEMEELKQAYMATAQEQAGARFVDGRVRCSVVSQFMIAVPK